MESSADRFQCVPPGIQWYLECTLYRQGFNRNFIAHLDAKRVAVFYATLLSLLGNG